MASCFPSGKPLLPDCHRLLIQGESPPSFPIHLCLSHLGLANNPRTSAIVIYCGSSHGFTDRLQEFNDEYLSKRSGDGKVSSFLARIRMMYPPTIGHLRGVLELLRPKFSGLPGASVLAFEPPPCALVLVDPSNYFLGSEIESTFSNYSSLLVQALATASFMDSAEKGSRPAIWFTVFDRGIGRMHLPILSFPEDDNPDPSSSPQRQRRRETAEEDETELVYKYFDAVGIIEALVQGSSDVDRISEIPGSKQFVMRFLATETGSSLPSPLYWNEEAGEINTWAGIPSTRIKSRCD